MIQIKDFNNAVQPTVQKIDNMILMFIRKKFVNVSAKNTAQCILEKRENVGIMKTYHLYILLMVIIY